MNKWAVRIAGIFVVLVLLFMLMNLQRQLVALQRQRQGATPATTTR